MSDIDFGNFRARILYKRKFSNECKHDILRTLNLFHIVLHESALKYFLEILNEDITVMLVSELWNEEHVHLIAWSRKPFEKNPSNIRIETIKNEARGIFIIRNFIDSRCKKRHDLVCNITFNTILSEKDIELRKILMNSSYLHDIKSSLNDLFQQSLSYYNLPEYKGKEYKANFELFFKIDHIHDKEAVVWFHNATCLHIPYKFIVSFNFFSEEKKIKMCTYCMQFQTKDGDYHRIYKLKYSYTDGCFPHVYVQNPVHWCKVCHQVPLFQLLSLTELEKQYKYFPIEIDSYFKDTLKTEYFKNGIKI